MFDITMGEESPTTNEMLGRAQVVSAGLSNMWSIIHKMSKLLSERPDDYNAIIASATRKLDMYYDSTQLSHMQKMPPTIMFRQVTNIFLDIKEDPNGR